MISHFILKEVKYGNSYNKDWCPLQLQPNAMYIFQIKLNRNVVWGNWMKVKFQLEGWAIPFFTIQQNSGKKTIRDIIVISNPSDIICKPCQHEKQTRVNLKTNGIHNQVTGTFSCKPLQAYKNTSIKRREILYASNDDYTRMTLVTFLKQKFETFDKLKTFRAPAENEIYLKIKNI